MTRKPALKILVLALTLAAWGLAGVKAPAISALLPIPARLQWRNNAGYCGELSIQSCAMYFGTYASQYRIREIMDPTQKQDLWIGYHEKPVLEALRLTYDAWNPGQAAPQYQKYLGWAKNHLHSGHPVIITLFMAGHSDLDYDHIVPAVGFTSASDWTTYHESDTLTFYDDFDLTSFTRTFGTLYDTRAMQGNGAVYQYCIPRDVDYGCALTGIRDDDKSTLPVRLAINRYDEPNVTLGESPVTLTGTLTIGKLAAGRRYTLLRYDDYHNVPARNFLASAATSRQTFTAAGATHTLTDHFPSNGVTIYRCVPATNAAEAWGRYE